MSKKMKKEYEANLITAYELDVRTATRQVAVKCVNSTISTTDNWVILSHNCHHWKQL